MATAVGGGEIGSPQQLVIGLAGKKRVGKGTLENYLKNHSWIAWNVKSFARPLRTVFWKLVGNSIAAQDTYSNAEKARMVDLRVHLGPTMGNCVDRVLMAFEACAPLHTTTAKNIGIVDSGSSIMESGGGGSGGNGGGAVPLDKWLIAIDGWLGTSLKRHYNVSARETPLDLPEEKRFQSVGELLQCLGTDLGRAVLGEDVWLTALHNEWMSEGGAPLLVTDVRFPNELAYLRRLGGKIIYIDASVRLGGLLSSSSSSSSSSSPEAVPEDAAGGGGGSGEDSKVQILSSSAASLFDTDAAAHNGDGRSTSHTSETALDDMIERKQVEFDLILSNNGSLVEFHRQLRSYKRLQWLAALRPPRPPPPAPPPPLSFPSPYPALPA